MVMHVQYMVTLGNWYFSLVFYSCCKHFWHLKMTCFHFEKVHDLVSSWILYWNISETLSGRIFHIEILMEKFIKLCNVYYYHPKGQSFVNVNKSVRLIICFRDYSIWWINSSIKMCWILCKTQCLIIPLMESALHIMYLYLWIDLSLHQPNKFGCSSRRVAVLQPFAFISKADLNVKNFLGQTFRLNGVAQR